MKTKAPNYAVEIAVRPGKQPLHLDADGAVTIEAAAEYFDLEPKRLRGYVYRRDWVFHHDPIGDAATARVYPWSVERFLKHRDARG